MNKNIKTQLLVVNTAALAVVFTIMSIYLVGKNTATLKTRLQKDVQSFSTLATSPIGNAYGLYGESGTDRVRETIKSYLDLSDSVVNVTIVDLQGKSLFAYTKNGDLEVTAEQASTFAPIFNTANNNLRQVIYPYFGSSGAHSYTVVYSVSNEQINNAVRSQTISLILFSFLSLFVTSAITYLAINRIILNPVRQVSRQAAAVSAGNLDQQISVKGNNEIAALGTAVNTMAESLKASIVKLQEIDRVKSEFMAITSHNLRTPITIISGYLENIDLLNTVEELKSAMNRIADSVKRLGGFAEDVLIISRFELGEKNSSKERVKINDFMKSIAEESKATAALRQIEFTASLRTDAEVIISKPHIRNAILNLIDNAIKFTPQNGSIKLSVEQRDGSVLISIADTGIGITKDEIPKLFTKFHRATSVEQYDYEGTGIGLYASKIIIEEHGGHITAASKEGKGSTFSISLPVAVSAI